MPTASSHSFLGKWITNRDFAPLEPVNVFHRQFDKIEINSTAPENSHILFRSQFRVKGTGRVKIYISADDYYKLYINGIFAGQGPAPGYPQHYYYNEIDITGLTHKGENTIAVHTYYQGLINRVWVSGDDRHGLILDIEEDGENILASDESFRCAYHRGFTQCGKVGYETQFMECYNSAAPEVGFEKGDFDDSGWENAVARKHTDYTLFPQPTKMLQFNVISPVSERRGEGSVTYDFGRCYVGYLLAEARGAEGEEITLLFGQELDAEGEVRFKLRANCTYRESWLLSGGNDTLNEFDYKAFQYAKLVIPEGAVVSRVRLLARHYPFECIAKPNTDDPTLLRVWELCRGSLEYGCQEVIQDCMEREKGNYLGDGCYTALAHTVMTGDASMLKKLIDDSLRSSFINRGLVTCAACSMMQEIAEYPLMMYYTLYSYAKFSGDTEYLREIFDAIKDVLDFYRQSYEKENGLVSDFDKWCVVEWPANYRDGYDVDLTDGKICHDCHNVINAHYIGAIKYMNKICKLLGYPEYRDTVPLERAYVEAFLDREQGLFKDSVSSSHISAVGNVFPLMYELYPDMTVAENIIAMMDRKGYDSVMLFGAYPFLEGLRILGKKDKIFDYIKSDATWGRLLSEGAGQTFEGWGRDTKWNTSLYHLTLSYALMFLCDWDKGERSGAR